LLLPEKAKWPRRQQSMGLQGDEGKPGIEPIIGVNAP